MLKVVALSQIEVSEERQRKSFPEQEMLELRDSIYNTDHGLLQPLLVRPDPDREDHYILVAGERRLKAISSKKQPYMFGDMEVEGHYLPVIVKNFVNDFSAEEAELHENVYRLNLTWQEHANAIARLHKFKQARDPKHNRGMTAKLIEPNGTGDYASSKAYREVQSALLVEDFMDDPEISKAGSLWDATRMVSKRLEEDALADLAKRNLTDLTARETLDVEPEDLDTSLNTLLTDVAPSLPELPEQKVREPGTLLVGDCLEKMDTFPAGTIDIVIADPPYGIDADQFKNFGSTINTDHQYRDTEEMAMFLYMEMINKFDRICTEHAHVYMFCDAKFIGQIQNMFGDSWRVRNAPLVWRKGSQGTLSEGVGTGWTRTTEFIVVATRGNRPYAAIHGDVLDVPRVKDKKHGAEKPVELYEKLLAMSGLPDDTVLDPCCGSGPIFTAAYKKLMKPIGIELSPKHALIAEERRKQR